MNVQLAYFEAFNDLARRYQWDKARQVELLLEFIARHADRGELVNFLKLAANAGNRPAGDVLCKTPR